MQRSFRHLNEGPYDLLVVGGGIYGAWTAYDGALRGLSVALVEKDDWASATSSASSKLIHGGLRYLEHGWFGLVRASLAERRRLARLGPHRVRPLRFALPIYSGDRVSRLKLRAGLWIYDRLAGTDQPVEPHRYLDREELSERVPLEERGLLGGFTFGDCQTDDARFTLEIVDGAVGAGALALNRARATRWLIERGRVVGATVEDGESGETLDVRAAVTASCTGGFSGRLATDTTGASPVRLTKGVHLVLPGLSTDLALFLVSNDDHRIVFALPWYGRTLLGTTDTDYEGDPDEVRVEPADVTYLLDRANRALPAPGFKERDVIGSFAGLRAFEVSTDRAPSARSREWCLTEPRPGLLLPIGGKYTSARADAARLVDRALQLLGRPVVRSPTDERPFPWCPAGSFESWRGEASARGKRLGLDEETAGVCALRHGARIGRIFARIETAPALARRIVPDAPFCRAEVVHAAAEEMARGLEDVLRRRVPLLLLSRLGEETLRDVADLVGAELGWPKERKQREIETLLARTRPRTATHGPV